MIGIRNKVSCMIVCIMIQICGVMVSTAQIIQADNGSLIAINNSILSQNKLFPDGTYELGIDKVIGHFRASGTIIISDPSERCFAIPARCDEFTDTQIHENSNYQFLVHALLDSITDKQLDRRQYGYVQKEILTPDQYAIASKVLRGKTGEGDLASVGVWPLWKNYIVTYLDNGYPECRMLNLSISPPSISVIIAPSLSGSLLWWCWPYTTSSLRDKTITISSNSYSLSDLVNLLGKNGDCTVVVDESIADIQVFVSANNATIEKLLWALEVSTGVVVTVIENDKPLVLLESSTRIQHFYRDDRRKQVVDTHDGVYNPVWSSAGKHLISQMEGRGMYATYSWIGWKYSQLPLLMRNLITAGWQKSTVSDLLPQRFSSTPDSRAIWIKAIRITLVSSEASGARTAIFDIPVIE